jgi:nitrate reductase NapE component
MPSSICMIGTDYFGRTQPHTYGSYITTEWTTIFVPIIPMRSLRIRPVEGFRDTFQYVKDSKYYENRFELLGVLPTLHSEQVSHVAKGVAAFLLALAIALIPVIYIGFVHNNATGYIVFMAILCLSYLIFSFWVHGYHGSTPASSLTTRRDQQVTPPGHAPRQQPRQQEATAFVNTPTQRGTQAKCPFCRSTTFRVVEEAGSRRCSNCYSVLPNYIQENK